jgi:ubiquitin-conjugating enzyme E2 I
MTWECGVPGRSGGLWDGGLYTCALRFPPSYPMSPPTCTFTPSLPHPNVFTSGAVCLSILSYDWRPSITLKQVANICCLSFTCTSACVYAHIYNMYMSGCRS